MESSRWEGQDFQPIKEVQRQEEEEEEEDELAPFNLCSQERFMFFIAALDTQQTNWIPTTRRMARHQPHCFV